MQRAVALLHENREAWLELAREDENERRALYAEALQVALACRAEWFRARSVIIALGGGKVSETDGRLAGEEWAPLELALRREAGLLPDAPRTVADNVEQEAV